MDYWGNFDDVTEKVKTKYMFLLHYGKTEEAASRVELFKCGVPFYFVNHRQLEY